MEYTNPVIPGFHPDPSVCRVGEEYYLATSTFEYAPGVALYRSPNLVEWEPIGHCLTRPAQLELEDVAPSEGIFAPTLRHHDGTYYLVTTNVSAGGHFVVTAEDPRGEWSEPLWIDAPGIDPDLFWDEDGDDTGDGDGNDGTVYLTYRGGADGIEQAELDLETGELGETRHLCNRLEGDYTEAPHLYEIDGRYYLLVAEGGTHTRHRVCAARADSPTGPFEPCPENPVLSHRNVSGMHNEIQATGHGDLVRAHDGTWWMVFLGIRKQGGHPGWHHLGRETFLAPVTWVDGWPVVNGGDQIQREMSVSTTDLERTGDQTWTTTEPFDGDELGPAWNYRYPPERERYVLEDGSLILHGGPATLDDRNSTFVGRRQQHLECRVTADLTFDPVGDDEAGLTAIYDESHHYDLGVTRRDGVRRALLRLTIGDVSDVIAETPLPSDSSTLVLEATADTYRFSVTSNSRGDGSECGDKDSTETLGTAATRYLSTEVAGGFTGVYVGPYATGHGTESETRARFDSVAYRPRD